MKEHVLSPDNRAALQGLIALSGALGVGALLARFFLDRDGKEGRDLGFAIFEVFAVVAILTASGLTAYFSVLFLREGEAISDADFAQVSAPLVVAITLLVLLSAVSRISNLPRPWVHLSTLSATLAVAILAGSAVPILNPPPSMIFSIGLAILAAGAVVSWAAMRFERSDLTRRQRIGRERMAKLSASGYMPIEKKLRVAVPGKMGTHEEPTAICWKRDEELYLDQVECHRLSREVSGRWADVAYDKAIPPRGETALVRLALKTTLWKWSASLRLIVAVHDCREPEPDIKTIEANESGLFTVTGLGIVD
jgi:hypothetical protein